MRNVCRLELVGMVADKNLSMWLSNVDDMCRCSENYFSTEDSQHEASNEECIDLSSWAHGMVDDD